MADIKLFSLKGQVKELNSNQVPLKKNYNNYLNKTCLPFLALLFLNQSTV